MIDRDPIYFKYAVLFRPQFSFTGASEIHVSGDNFSFCNIFCIEGRLSLLSN